MVPTHQSKITNLLNRLRKEIHLSIVYKRLILPSKIRGSFKKKGGHKYSKQVEPGSKQFSLILCLKKQRDFKLNQFQEINKNTLF